MCYFETRNINMLYTYYLFSLAHQSIHIETRRSVSSGMIVRMLRIREDRLKRIRSLAQLCRLVLRAFGVGRELFESERPSSREFSCNATRIKESLFFVTHFRQTSSMLCEPRNRRCKNGACTRIGVRLPEIFSGHLMIIIFIYVRSRNTSFQIFIPNDNYHNRHRELYIKYILYEKNFHAYMYTHNHDTSNIATSPFFLPDSIISHKKREVY